MVHVFGILNLEIMKRYHAHCNLVLQKLLRHDLKNE